MSEYLNLYTLFLESIYSLFPSPPFSLDKIEHVVPTGLYLIILFRSHNEGKHYLNLDTDFIPSSARSCANIISHEENRFLDQFFPESLLKILVQMKTRPELDQMKIFLFDIFQPEHWNLLKFYQSDEKMLSNTGANKTHVTI